MNNLILTESKSLRQENIDKVEVLEKVKAVKYLTKDFICSVEQAAEYYEVPKETITTIYNRNIEELSADGYKVLRGDELSKFKSEFQDEIQLKGVPNFAIIPRRALLRIGMLLQKSEVAKQVRDYLLNTEEKALSETQLKQQLLLSIYNGGQDGIIASKQLTEIETAPLKEKIEVLEPLADLAKKRIDKTGTVSLTDIQKTYSLKRGQITCWAKTNGYLKKTGHEVNIKGDTFFKVVEDNGYKNIAIKEEGIYLIDENIKDIRQSKCVYKK